MLVPSFSSRVPKIEKILRASEAFIEGPFLISAYDVKHGHILPPYDFGSVVFLDSGGYEVARDRDLSDVGDENDVRRIWSEPEHAAVLAEWNPAVPSLIISFDHPKLRHKIGDQISHAKQLKIPRDDMAREILIKPETVDQDFIQMEPLLASVRDLTGFDAIGVTEKEIGNAVWDRMLNIARLRVALNKVDLRIPIHVFGSLDTTTTLFYFVAGADIFDGLTWVRYAFKDGQTLYRQAFGILEFGIGTASPKVEAQCWANNYNYMKEMELTEMKRFLKDHDFAVFKHHGSALKAAYDNVREELGV
jgi:hypothetical protein